LEKVDDAMLLLAQSSNTEQVTTNDDQAIRNDGFAIKENEIESENQNQLLINIERNSIFDRLSKQSEDELKVNKLLINL
jgi:hypothetical protein